MTAKIVLYFVTPKGGLKAKKFKKRDIKTVACGEYCDTLLVFFHKRMLRGVYLGEYVEVVNYYESLVDALIDYPVNWIGGAE